MKLIVQIPAFNEEATIAQTLRDLPKTIEGITAIETLVIDDGSSDKTAAAARAAGATHVIELKTHRGLSSAFIAGIDAALRLGADVIVNTDGDNQYAGADVGKLVAPIVKGSAEVVIGDRQVANSPHMSPLKRILQRLGSWAVGRASGLDVADVTSGFRAFTREAAVQINVFNPFTYTLETIIQSGNRNLGVQSVAVRTNAPTRQSRLYRGVGTYLRKSVATIFRIYTLYKPLKTFFAIGAVLMLAGAAIGARFLWFFVQGERGGHIQSLILAAIFLIIGFQTLLIALVADLISVNRRLTEEVLIRLKRMEAPAAAPAAAPPAARPARPARAPRQEPRPQQPAQQARRERSAAAPPAAAAAPADAAKPAATQWIWLMDEEKLNDRGAKPAAAAPPPADPSAEDDALPAAATAKAEGEPGRRRRRRRGGIRQHPELPGNRGKHLGDE
jgi:glycosyltransferase involved in cell wall biosynthesis